MQRHFTATAFVINDSNRTLLLWHRRMGRWMPPGGHIDENETPEEAALRECKEETGLDVKISGQPQEDLFTENPDEDVLMQPVALLLENIPASKDRGEPTHQHMDFVFLARLIDDTQQPILAEEEGDHMHWFSRDEILALDDKTEIFSNVKAYILKLLPNS